MGMSTLTHHREPLAPARNLASVKSVAAPPWPEPFIAAPTELNTLPDLIARAPKALSDPAFDPRAACRWPLPTPDARDQTLFCCNARGGLRPYCADHTRRAFVARRPPEQVAAEAAARRNRAAEARRADFHGGSFDGEAGR